MIAAIRNRWSCFAVLLMMASATTARAADAPPVDAVRAARVATDHLSKLGPNAPYIVSVSLEDAAIGSSKRSWIVLWSRPVVSDGDKELGLRVNLDGSSVRLVEGKSSGGRWRANNMKR